MTIKLSRLTKAEIRSRLTTRLMPTRYEEPNQVEARRLAEIQADQLLEEVLIIETLNGRMIAPATVEV